MRPTDPSRRPPTRHALTGVIAASVLVATAACGPDQQATEAEDHDVVSRPDLDPPQVTITPGEAWSSEDENAGEYTFVTPGFEGETPSTGAMILDARGELVWMSKADKEDPNGNYFDFRVQQYRGEPVLSYYLGSSGPGYGEGEFILLDENYEEITRVTTGGDLGPGRADFHDSTITAQDTMLLMAYVPTPADLSPVGGPQDGWAMDSVIQEIDIATGEVLFDWSSLEHVPLTDTRSDFEEERAEDETVGTEELPFDYFHINSITEDDDGSLLISARNTHAVYRLDRQSGDIDWTLGGSASDFEMGEGTVFSWQHDAQRAPDGTLTLLDNHNDSGEGESSRGLRLALDEEAMTASVDTEYAPPEERPAGSMANAQQLDDGEMLLGWGQQPFYSKYTRDGELVYDAHHGGDGSYRAYEAQWEGRPSTDPDVVVREDGDERVAHVSWNGATEVEQWRLLTGDDESGATPQETVERDGFETAITVADDAAYVAVEALDAEGEVLATGIPEDS